MADSQSNRQAKNRARSKESREHTPSERADSNSTSINKSTRRAKNDADKSPALEIAEETATVGQAGERNLQIEWVDVWIGNSKPCYFNVSTVAGHALEFEIQQLSYQKKYTGEHTIKTDVIPVAPIGTRGKLIARDLTTGEMLEQGIVWRDMGGQSFFSWVIATTKKLFVG